MRTHLCFLVDLLSIIDFANTEKAYLIVLGNVGLSGMSKVKALGSTSRAIVENSICHKSVLYYTEVNRCVHKNIPKTEIFAIPKRAEKTAISVHKEYKPVINFQLLLFVLYL
jgi:Universal stress protein family